MKTNKIDIKKILPHLGVVLFFFLLTFLYFQPVFQGQDLMQMDVVKYEGVSKELDDFKEPTGWLGSMFSGMPTYQVRMYPTDYNVIFALKDFIVGMLEAKSAGPIFFMLIFSYILFLALGMSIPLSVLGAVATTFPSYNFIIIDAGHVTKLWALAITPLVLAGLLSIFKKRYILGALLFSFGLSFQISNNHIQITYYLAILCLILFLAYLVSALRKKELKDLYTSIAVLAVSVLIAVGSNAVKLYETQELSKESIRGKTELTPLAGQGDQVKDGLDKEYLFSWSYGKAETLTLLVPNLMGGVSQVFGEDSECYKTLLQKAQSGQVNGEQANQLYSYSREYWGDQPFTSGPVYFGAIVCFLFVFSLFIVRSKVKWWLLGATLFFIALSWGKNLAWFNDLMYYYFPLYNKFRTVSMTLVIPGFIFPILAVMALKELFSDTLDKVRLRKSLWMSAGITGGICLLLCVASGLFFQFYTDMERQAMPGWFLEALVKDRKALLQADALRSLVFILLSAGVIYWYIQSKLTKTNKIIVSCLLIGLVLIDMWQVDKRYLNDGKFIDAKKKREQTHPKMPANEAILKDQSPSYRVLNLNNPFNETYTSYYHKSIGGYHAAKLRRYQDLIERRFTGEIQQIINALQSNPTEESLQQALAASTSLNMFNMKYVIYNPSQPPLLNESAYGAAWFVDSYRFVDNADEEMAALATLDPRKEAVLDKQFAGNVNLQIVPDSTATIEMTSYQPNKVVYKSSSRNEGLAVFSEVYYPYGWKAFIDGQQVEISRADWMLRALVVPAGEHEITMVFDHDGIAVCRGVEQASSTLLILLLAGGVAYSLFVRKKEKKN